MIETADAIVIGSGGLAVPALLRRGLIVA